MQFTVAILGVGQLKPLDTRRERQLYFGQGDGAGRRIRLRCTPELSFQLDETLAYSEHIQRLLLQVQREDGEKHNG